MTNVARIGRKFHVTSLANYRCSVVHTNTELCILTTGDSYSKNCSAVLPNAVRPGEKHETIPSWALATNIRHGRRDVSMVT